MIHTDGKQTIANAPVVGAGGRTRGWRRINELLDCTRYELAEMIVALEHERQYLTKDIVRLESHIQALKDEVATLDGGIQ